MSRSRSRQQRSGCGCGALFAVLGAIVGAIVKAIVSVISWLNHQRFTLPIRGKNVTVSLLGALGLLTLAASCCGITYVGMGAGVREAGVLPTYTLAPTNTPRATHTPQPTPTSTPMPTPTRTSTPRPSPSATSAPIACTWSAAYVADVTIPDGTRLDPGAAFVKTWRIQNNGTCDWENARLAFASGEQMQALSSVSIPPTAAGAEVDISVEMIAPATVGNYSAAWSVCQGDNCFSKVTMQIVSGDLATAAPPQPTEPPAPTDMPVPPTEAPQPTALPAPVGPNIRIIGVDKQAEFVDIRNDGDQPQDLGGWVLVSEKGDQKCTLGGVINPGEVLRIWAMTEDAGQGGYNCGFGSDIWNNSEPDPAALYDNAGQLVARYP